MEEKQRCKICGGTWPLSSFRLSKSGRHIEVCNHCVTEKLRESRAANRPKIGGGKQQPLSDPDFDNKQPVEIIQLMSRAKRWLESRGYDITLYGEYKETKVHKVKF